MTEKQQSLLMGYLLGSGDVDTSELVMAIKKAHEEGIELNPEWEKWAEEHPEYFN